MVNDFVKALYNWLDITHFFHLTDFIQTLHIHIYITHRHTSTLSQFTLEQKANNRSYVCILHFKLPQVYWLNHDKFIGQKKKIWSLGQDNIDFTIRELKKKFGCIVVMLSYNDMNVSYCRCVQLTFFPHSICNVDFDWTMRQSLRN